MDIFKYPDGEGGGDRSIRYFGVVLILQLFLHWGRGVLLGLVRYLFEDYGGYIFVHYVVKMILTVEVFLLPVFLYLKLTGKSGSNLLRPRENAAIYRVQTRKVGYKILFFVFAAAITLNIANLAGMLTDVFYGALGKTTPTSILFPEYRILILAFLSSVILAPILEELLFRSVAINVLSPYGMGWSVLLSGILFALMHYSAYSLFYAFCAGCVIAFFAYISNSVLVAMGLHFVNNLLAYCSSYLSGRYGSTAAERFGNILLAITLPIAVLGVLFFLKEKVWRSANGAEVSGESDGFGSRMRGAPIGIEMVAYALVALLTCFMQ